MQKVVRRAAAARALPRRRCKPLRDLRLGSPPHPATAVLNASNHVLDAIVITEHNIGMESGFDFERHNILHNNNKSTTLLRSTVATPLDAAVAPVPTALLSIDRLAYHFVQWDVNSDFQLPT